MNPPQEPYEIKIYLIVKQPNNPKDNGNDKERKVP
jgi:hypothetical protein